MKKFVLNDMLDICASTKKKKIIIFVHQPVRIPSRYALKYLLLKTWPVHYLSDGLYEGSGPQPWTLLILNVISLIWVAR